MPPPDQRPLPARILDELRRADSVAVLTGAGMSAESGVATFRDARDGLWAKCRPEDLATPEAFEADPALVWDWYQSRRERVHAVKPHAGYHALVELGKLVRSLTIITQNVDGLHRAAGSRDVIELHGNIRRSVCSRTRKPIDDDWISAHPGPPPPSPHAEGGFARPDVVWFGETLPEDALDRAWMLAEQAGVFLSIGTSALVHPAASLPLAALRSGATLIEINLEPTPLSDMCRLCIRQPAGVALPLIAAQLQDC